MAALVEDRLKREYRRGVVHVRHVDPTHDPFAVGRDARGSTPDAASQGRVQIVPERINGVGIICLGDVRVYARFQAGVGNPEQAIGTDPNLRVGLAVEWQNERKRKGTVDRVACRESHRDHPVSWHPGIRRVRKVEQRHRRQVERFAKVEPAARNALARQAGEGVDGVEDAGDDLLGALVGETGPEQRRRARDHGSSHRRAGVELVRIVGRGPGRVNVLTGRPEMNRSQAVVIKLLVIAVGRGHSQDIVHLVAGRIEGTHVVVRSVVAGRRANDDAGLAHIPVGVGERGGGHRGDDTGIDHLGSVQPGVVQAHGQIGIGAHAA